MNILQGPDRHITSYRYALVLSGILIATTAWSQVTLQAPQTVRVGSQFTVIWTGPDIEGDQITVADQGSPSASSRRASATSAGSPLFIQAPFEAGTYEIRYISESSSILEMRLIEVFDEISSGLSEPVDDEHTYSELLLVTGYQIEHSARGGEMMQRRAQMCSQWAAAEPALRQAASMTEAGMRQEMANADPGLATLLTRVEGAMNIAGVDIFRDFEHHLDAAEEALCNNEDAPYSGHFTISYAYCRMTMDTPTGSLDIHMPPNVPAAYMQAIDFVKEEGIMIDLARDLAGTMPATGTGWSNDIQMSPTGRNKELIGYDTRQYRYKYTAGMGGGSAMDAISGMVSVTNSGSAYVAPNVEGDSIPRRFYWNLASQVQPGTGMANMLTGMIKNLAGLLQNGLPLEIESKVSSKIMGVTVLSSNSESNVTDVRLVPMPDGWCERSIVPPDFDITNINEQLDSVMGGGSNQGMTAEQQQEMDANARQMNEVMQNITPEQKAMMEKMGMGDMLGNMLGNQKQGSSAATSPASGGTPKSKSLQSANLTQTAQNYLKALGYDPGNTDGTVSMDTTIAISQFQAENGMEVTGDVSPQLVGMLAAKVDGN